MEVASTLIPIQDQTDVAEARRRATERAMRAGFDEIALGRLAIGVTEVATNLLKHAGGGEILVGPGPGEQAVQVLAIDRGRGMRNVAGSLRDGYSTAGTQGTGLGAIARAANSFDLYSQPGGGTVVAATYSAGHAPVRALPVGGLAVAMPGETECGDGWAIWSAGELTSIFMCDGLGHGPAAAATTALALTAFRRHAERNAADVLASVHEALRGSRGAAVAVAEMDHRQGSLRFCGIGNISAAIVKATGDAQHLVSLPGIAGHIARRTQTFAYDWAPGSTLVMHSDGIGTHWSLRSYEGLAARCARVIAGVVFRDHRRGSDDASVVVARHGDPS